MRIHRYVFPILVIILLGSSFLSITSQSESLEQTQISDPEFSIKDSFTRGSSDSRQIAVQDQFGFVADGIEGLRIVSIINFEIKSTLKSTISTISLISTGGFAQDVVVDGNYAYVANGADGLAVINITDIYNPVLISSLVTNRPAFSIDKQGDIVYISDDFPSAAVTFLESIDVSDPSSPIRLDTAQVSSNTDGMFVNGSYAFVVGNYWVDIVNITDPSNIETISQIDHNYISNDVRVQGNYVYIAYQFGMYIYDVTDILSPVLAYNYNIGKSAVAIDLDDYMVVIAGTTFMQILSLNTPISPTLSREITMPDGFVSGVELNGTDKNFVYVASGIRGIYTVSISADALTIGIIGNLDPPSDNFQIIDKYNGYLYIKSGYDIISIYNTTDDPAVPVFVTDILTSDNIVDFILENNKIFIANSYHGLLIYDIIDPGNPTIWSQINTGSKISDVDVEGNYAYVLDTGGLTIIDISTKNALSVVSSLSLMGSRESVTFSNYIIYITNQYGFLSIDVSKPNAPQLLDSVDIPGLTRGAIIKDGLAFVLESSYGIKIFDLSNPHSLTLYATYNLNVLMSRAFEIAGLLFVTADYAGFNVLNITDPAHITAYAEFDHPSTSYPTEDIFVDGNLIYAAYAQGGGLVLELVDAGITLPTQTVVSSVTSTQYETSIRTELISKYITKTNALSFSGIFVIALSIFPLIKKQLKG